ncbi:MAG: peptidoglycan editing factor PgeF [Candidatus Kuenenia sp.]|nr:peptidoglycan editing factor PgeF [Candidatus Kuenenia hertensis]
MIEKKINSIMLCFFQNLLECNEICHFITTRMDGYSKNPYNSLNLGFHVGDDSQTVLENRKQLANSIGVPLCNFTTAQQVHGDHIEIISENDQGCGSNDYETAVVATDAMVSSVQNICLMVLVADCVPILLFDRKKKIIGVVHAGWKGTVHRIAQKTVILLKEKFGCSGNDILIGIGPSIGPCCYIVDMETITGNVNVSEENNEIILHGNRNGNGNGKGYFDLWETNKLQFKKMGIPEKNIETAGKCTSCNNDIFYSHRKEEGRTGRFGVGIMLNKI